MILGRERAMTSLKHYLPILQWLPAYGRDTLASDLLAAIIVTVMLIPQSLAYAMLAGLPPRWGFMQASLRCSFMRFSGPAAPLP